LAVCLLALNILSGRGEKTSPLPESFMGTDVTRRTFVSPSTMEKRICYPNFHGKAVLLFIGSTHCSDFV